MYRLLRVHRIWSDPSMRWGGGDQARLSEMMKPEVRFKEKIQLQK